MRRRGQQKTPLRCRCGVLWVVQVSFALPGHAPSARTSVDNKEYEYEGKKEVAADLQASRNRQETDLFGDVKVAVALRHVVDPNGGRQDMSTVSFEIFYRSRKLRRCGRLDVQMSGRFQSAIRKIIEAQLERPA